MGWWKSDDRETPGRDHGRYAGPERRQKDGAVREFVAEIWERPGTKSRLPEDRPRRRQAGHSAR
jgi:hypothetical protein